MNKTQRVQCVHWEFAGIQGGGGCKIHAHGSYLVSFSVCDSCRVRTTEEGRVKRVIKLLMADEVEQRAAIVKPVCAGCPHFRGFSVAVPGMVFEDMIGCVKCHCALKITSIYSACPEGKFK